MTWLLSIECLDTTNAAKTLYFSDDSYVSDSFIVYPNRLIQPANLNISPNDGGVLSIFKDSSVGDIELDNTDREFDYLIPNSTTTYKLDGRNAILKLDGTEYLRATIDAISERDNKIVLSLKALWDSMTTPIDLAEYLGDSLGANDLEGDADLKGTAKPIVYGYCKNITPFRTGGVDKEIYQASNSDDAVIIATYAKGNRDTNYLLSANASAGASSIAVYGGNGGIPTGSWLAIKAANGEINFYQTTSSVADDATVLPATVSLSIPLINSLTGSPTTAITHVEIVNSYASTAAMIEDDSIPLFINYRSINGYFRRGSNSASDVITCDVVTRPTGDTLIAGLFVVNDYYRIVSIGSTSFTAIGAASNTIGLIFKATGVGSGTGTAQEINPFITAKAFDVFEKIARSGSRVWSVNQALKSTINAYGDLGLYYDTEAPQKDLLNDVIRSIGGIYWFVGDEIQIYLLTVPSTPSFVIHEYMVLDNPIITRENTGLGINGVPYQGYKVGFDKIEMIMTTGLSGVLELNPEIKTFLGNEYRYVKTINETTKSQRLLSKLCEFNSLLRNRAQLELIITRLSSLTTVRRDVVSFAVKLDELPVFSIGDTVTLEHRNFGYSAGRNMVIIGYEIDAQAMIVKFLVCG